MNRRRLVETLVVVFLVLAGGMAYAYWSGSGGGSGSSSTGGSAPVTLSPAAAAADLYPGGVTSVALTVTNPNNSPVRIGSLALDTAQGAGGFDVDGGHRGCAVSALSFTTQTTGWTVPANAGGTNGTLAVTLAGALAMSPSAANACQGANFTVYLVAGP